MSDGNFNRSLLPHGDFSSGVRVGRASERSLCMEVMARWLQQRFPSLDEKEREELLQSFKQMLLSKEK